MEYKTKYLLSNVSIFQNLNEEELKAIYQMSIRRNYPKGKLILRAGDEKKMLFIVQNGRVKVERLIGGGHHQILRFVGSGDFFGVTTLFQEEPLLVNVEAVESTNILMLEGEKLKSFLINSPTVLFKIMEQITKRMRLLEERLGEVSLKEVDARVANYILEQIDETNNCFTLSFSKKDLASLLGTTRESISRKFSEFQRLGYIDIDENEIEIINHPALEQIALK